MVSIFNFITEQLHTYKLNGPDSKANVYHVVL